MKQRNNVNKTKKNIDRVVKLATPGLKCSGCDGLTWPWPWKLATSSVRKDHYWRGWKPGIWVFWTARPPKIPSGPGFPPLSASETNPSRPPDFLAQKLIFPWYYRLFFRQIPTSRKKFQFPVLLVSRMLCWLPVAAASAWKARKQTTKKGCVSGGRNVPAENCR